MAVLLMNGERYCKLINPLQFQVGTLPKDEFLRKHTLDALYEDSTVLDISPLEDVEARRVWKKFGNGMGSTDDAPAFVEAFILAGAKEVK